MRRFVFFETIRLSCPIPLFPFAFSPLLFEAGFILNPANLRVTSPGRLLAHAQRPDDRHRFWPFFNLISAETPIDHLIFSVSQCTYTLLGDTYLIQQKATILVASWDPVLADVRKTILEKEGFVVLQSKGSASVRALCRKKKINLVLIGYSVPPSEKRRVWAEARKACNSPILELLRGGETELIESNVFAHESRTPDDFVKSVRSVLRRCTN
jgi:CheY-like chemotaxis protein